MADVLDKSSDVSEPNAIAEMDIGSEEVPDVKCTTCDKNNPAKVFCCECHKLLCQACLLAHDMFLKNHTLEDMTTFHATQKCQDHPKQLLEMYCGNHNVVICHNCKEEKHRDCVVLQKLYEAAKGLDDQNLKKTIRDLNSANETIEKALEDTKKSESDLNLAKEDVKGEIEEIHEQLVEAANQWKKQALEELAKREKKLLEEKDCIKNKLQMGKSEVKETLAKLKDNTSNKCDLFCYVKEGEKIANQKDFLPSNESSSIKLVSNIGSVLEVIKKTAQVMEGDVGKPGASKLQAKTNIKSKKDTKTCHVTDMCQLSNGEFLVADYGNSKVKHLDTSYKSKKEIELVAPPRALCEVEPGLVAVTMDTKKEKIVLLKIDENNIEKTSMADCEVKNETEGIAALGGQLYICEKTYGLFSSSSQIGVYNIMGKQVKKFTPAQLSNALNITHDINKDVAYITDNKKDQILTMDMNGDILSTVSCGSSIKRPMGLCRGQNGDIFVAGHDSSSIGLLTMGGIKLKLSESDGLKTPRALCYDMLNDKLLVGCDDSDFIHVYTV